MSGNGQSMQAFGQQDSQPRTAAPLPLITGIAGAACGLLGVATAVAPASIAPLASLAGVLDRVGLDKGPLVLFGVTLGALSATMRRAERGAAGATSSEEASLMGQQLLGEVGGQSAQLAAVQAEVNAARMEIAEGRQEAHAARQRSENDEATDPMFRLAASLDQLGARIDKELSKTREEVFGAVEAIRTRVEDLGDRSRAEREAFAHEQRKLIQGMLDANATDSSAEDTVRRFDELRDEITQLTGALAGLSNSPTEAAPLPAELQESDEDSSAELTEPEPNEPEAPVNFCDGFQTPEASSEDEVTLESEEDSAAGSEEPVAENDGADVPDSLFVEMQESAAPLDAADVTPLTPQLPLGPGLTSIEPAPMAAAEPITEEPAAPLPAKNEYLEALEQIREENARPADLTPPMFPNLYPDSLEG